MKILFLCTSNRHRSRTAEDIFSCEMPQHHFKSAGLSEKQCRKNGTTMCNEDMLRWADKVYVFEAMHLERIKEHTGHMYISKTQCLNIEDIYQYMQPELVVEMHSKFTL